MPTVGNFCFSPFWLFQVCCLVWYVLCFMHFVYCNLLIGYGLYIVFDRLCSCHSGCCHLRLVGWTNSVLLATTKLNSCYTINLVPYLHHVHTPFMCLWILLKCFVPMYDSYDCFSWISIASVLLKYWSIRIYTSPLPLCTMSHMVD